MGSLKTSYMWILNLPKKEAPALPEKLSHGQNAVIFSTRKEPKVKKPREWKVKKNAIELTLLSGDLGIFGVRSQSLQGRIDRLEEIGLQWKIRKVLITFEERCDELIAFKAEFRDCNVPIRYAGNPSLGQWCIGMRSAYKNTKLSQERIQRLEEIGFQWKIRKVLVTFEERCDELIASKEEFRDCNVPSRHAGNASLGRWCSDMSVHIF